MSNYKKGDLVDLLLLQQKSYEDHNEPERISDYPEDVIETLRAFYKTWMLPEGAIPTKRKKSSYKEWVLQLQQLNTLFSNDKQMREAMKIAYSKYDKLLNKFLILRPLSIKSLLIDAVAELNRKKRKEKENSPASPEKLERTIKNLKSIFKEE